MSPAFPDVPLTESADFAPSLIRQVQDEFRQRLDAEPEIMILAPGRVNLIGEHVDYNDGFVLPMAIQRHVVIAAQRVDEPTATLVSQNQHREARIPLDGPIAPTEPSWANYPRGVLAGFQQLGITIPGFEAVIAANLPLGGGLSSSAALEVATCRLLEALTDHPLPDLDCIRLCQRAEHTFAGVPCGIMDQFIVTSAQRDHVLLLDCQSLDAQQIPLASDQVGILVTHSGVAHELGKGEYAKRRADCQRAAEGLGVSSLRSVTSAQFEEDESRLEPLARRRARHVIHEIQRTTDFAQCLQDADWLAAGRLMYDSHASLKEDYEVSCTALDTLVEIARSLGPERGVFGSRLTGAGFGGCTVTLVRTDEAEAVRSTMVDTYERQTGIQAQSFLTLPAAGGRRV
jgi:galactokinase